MDAASSRSGIILLPDLLQKLRRLLFKDSGIPGFSQNPCCLSRNQQAFPMINIGNKTLVRTAPALTFPRIGGIQSQPVPILEGFSPAVIAAVHPFHIGKPAFHTLILLFQNGPVSVKKIEIPRNDAGGIPPDRSSSLIAKGRNNIRYHSVFCLLLLGHIV